MEKREPKDLKYYFERFENDPSTFNDFQAMDYVKELKNQGKTDDAIEVGRTFLQVGEGLKSFIPHYGYALYNKFINVDEKTIEEKENVFFSMVDEITNLCKQEKYSPYEATINKAMKYVQTRKDIDYKKLLSLLNLLDAQKLSTAPFVNKEGKEFESKREKWYRLKVRSLYESQDYKGVIECANQALTQPIQWHYNNLSWIQYYRAYALVQCERYEEAENAYLALGNKISQVKSFDVLYDLYLNTGKTKEAYTHLIYNFFIKGYHFDELPLYLKVLEMTQTVEAKETAQIIESMIYHLLSENKKDASAFTCASEFVDYTSSELYDRLYNSLMDNLSLYIERQEGRVSFYNQDKAYGSIYVDGDDNLFFRQADYIYDEDVEKRDVVEYTVMKTFDVKKQLPTLKAVLIKTLYEDINY